MNPKIAEYSVFPFRPDSPSRAVELPDGSIVNPGGTAWHMEKNLTVEVAEVRVGVETGKVFLGFYLEDNLVLYPVYYFIKGYLGDEPRKSNSIEE